MLNTVYRLVAPRRFEVAFNDIDLNSDKVVVRPNAFIYLSRRPALLSGNTSGGCYGKEAADGSDS